MPGCRSAGTRRETVSVVPPVAAAGLVWLTPPCCAGKGFCIWHQACTKDDWTFDKLCAIVAQFSVVDGPECHPFDPTGVPPGNKAPCTHHVQKNVLGSHVDTIVGNADGDTSGLIAVVRTIKWGMIGPIGTNCTIRSPCAPFERV